MKLMICGANGQVGRHLVKVCDSEVGIEVLALSSNQLDIRTSSAVLAAAVKFKPNIIVNAAAFNHVDKTESEHTLAYEVNASAVEVLAGVANAVGAVLIHISTDYVFDGENTLPYNEQDQPRPINIYGNTKWRGEVNLLEKANKPILIRTSWVFSELENNFVAKMLLLSASQRKLSIVDDQISGPTYAGHLAEAILSIAKSAVIDPKFLFGIYHFSGFPFVSWFEFAKVIFKQSHNLGLIRSQPELVPISSEEYDSSVKRPKNSSLQTSQFFLEQIALSRDWQLGLDIVLSHKEKRLDESN